MYSAGTESQSKLQNLQQSPIITDLDHIYFMQQLKWLPHLCILLFVFNLSHLLAFPPLSLQFCVPLYFACHPHLVQFSSTVKSQAHSHFTALPLYCVYSLPSSVRHPGNLRPLLPCWCVLLQGFPLAPLLTVSFSLPYIFFFTVITGCCTYFFFFLRLGCQHWRTGLYLFSPTLWIKSSDCQVSRNTFGINEWNGPAQKSQRVIVITPPGLNIRTPSVSHSKEW